MSTLPTTFPRVPLKDMDPSMLVFELDRETARLMPENTELITSAATMASFLHRKQSRMVRGDLPRVPYIEHPLRVALRLVRWGVTDAEVVAAALLHDVLEDCDEELLKVFGQPGENAVACLTRLYGGRIALLVEQVSNPDGAEGYHRYVSLLAALGKPETLLIKAGDLKDNAGSIPHQLGHGTDRTDERLLRMLEKYLPTLETITEALARTALVASEASTFSRAADQLSYLLIDLNTLADEHGIR